VYQQILNDVYKQWLEEFDREAAFRRQLPRKELGGTPPARQRFGRIRRLRAGGSTPAVTRRYPQAQQCS
jgi:hypothetical protein